METETLHLSSYSISDIVKECIKQNNYRVSLIADDLIEKAKKETSTREEFIAYMKGAAFIYYRLAQREQDRSNYGNTISSPEEAIVHCYDLLPFMKVDERIEHIKLIGWLNEYIELKGGKAVQVPSEYEADKELSQTLKNI